MEQQIDVSLKSRKTKWYITMFKCITLLSLRITDSFFIMFLCVFYYFLLYILIVEDLKSMEKHKYTEKQNPALMDTMVYIIAHTHSSSHIEIMLFIILNIFLLNINISHWQYLFNECEEKHVKASNIKLVMK